MLICLNWEGNIKAQRPKEEEYFKKKPQDINYITHCRELQNDKDLEGPVGFAKVTDDLYLMGFKVVGVDYKCLRSNGG